MGKRRRALTTVDWAVLPPRDPSAAEQAEADWLNEVLQDLPDFEDLLFDLLDAIGKGFSCIELDWQRLGREWLPAAFNYREASWFQLDMATRNELRLRDGSAEGEARLLLDKMVVAGRAGNAELENLPDIFARVGSNAKSSNLSLDQTLALVETLSLVEPNAERLATLTDSTLRVFTNANYMKSASKATGIKFFDKDGSRRDALEVINDIKAKYDKLGTDAQRFKFINNAFGKTDLDTQRGLKTLLDADSLGKLDQVFTEVRDASGTIARDLPDAIGNAVDQTNRLKGALREAADGFAKPVNDTLSGLIKWGMDSKESGGLGLDGKDMLLGGAVGAAGLFGAARYGGKAISGIAGKLGGTAAGVATGKALEEAAGVQPVYVVNMPDSLGGNLGAAEKLADTAGDLVSPKTMTWLKSLLGTSVTALPAMGSGAMATAGAAVAGAGAAGYGVGTLLNDYLIDGTAVGDAIGKAVAYAISPFSEDARNAIAVNNKASELTIRIEGETKARVTQMNSDGLDMTVLTGRSRVGG
ncbi:MAG TPA: phage tail tape measure protein [Pseudomonas sp.]|nr:phage tail tape measure protein [[Pseudomonas] sp. BICA1-14]HBW09155.1 phage tail tape measure protein [Pseudomonas sp.]